MKLHLDEKQILANLKKILPPDIVGTKPFILLVTMDMVPVEYLLYPNAVRVYV